MLKVNIWNDFGIGKFLKICEKFLSIFSKNSKIALHSMKNEEDLRSRFECYMQVTQTECSPFIQNLDKLKKEVQEMKKVKDLFKTYEKNEEIKETLLKSDNRRPRDLRNFSVFLDFFEKTEKIEK